MLNTKFKKYDLDNKVDEFIRGYGESLKKLEIGTNAGKFHFPRNLRNFIESKAAYSELRWPFVYESHWRDKAIQENEKALEIFTWENFDMFKNSPLARPNLTEEDIDQQVLHRIIERGGSRSGSRRGVLFAQEFELDINVPVSYSIDFSDPHFYSFIEPLIPDLNLETTCPVDYFSRTSSSLRNVNEMKLRYILGRLSVKELVGAV